MKVLLLNPPADRLCLRDMYSSTLSKGSYYWPPVDLLVLSGIIAQEHAVLLFDANALRLNEKSCLKQIIEFNPDAMIFMAGSSTRDSDLGFAKSVKENIPGIKIIGNGGFLYHNPREEILKNFFLDAVLQGFIHSDILSYLINKDNDQLRNIVYRRNNEIFVNKEDYKLGFFSYPTPKHEQLPFKSYRLSHGIKTPLTSVLASYGCIGNCSFCVSANIRYQKREVANIINELKYIEKLGFKEFIFRDVAFGVSLEHTIDLCDKMIRSNLSLGWVCDMRADCIDNQRLKFMKKAGCHSIHIGVESANNRTLQKYNKGITREQLIKAFRLCKENGIRTLGYFILGLPFEIKKDMLETIDFSIKLDCDFVSFNFALPITGTDLRKECIDNEMINNNDNHFDGSLDPNINSSNITKDELVALRKLALRRFYFRPSYILKKVASVRSFKAFLLLIREFVNLLRQV